MQNARGGQISEYHIFALPPNATPCTVPPGAHALFAPNWPKPSNVTTSVDTWPSARVHCGSGQVAEAAGVCRLLLLLFECGADDRQLIQAVHRYLDTTQSHVTPLCSSLKCDFRARHVQFLLQQLNFTPPR